MTEPYFDASKILLRGRKYLNFHWPHGEKVVWESQTYRIINNNILHLFLFIFIYFYLFLFIISYYFLNFFFLGNGEIISSYLPKQDSCDYFSCRALWFSLLSFSLPCLFSFFFSEKSAKKDFFWPKLGETSTYNDYREHGGFKVFFLSFSFSLFLFFSFSLFLFFSFSLFLFFSFHLFILFFRSKLPSNQNN